MCYACYFIDPEPISGWLSKPLQKRKFEDTIEKLSTRVSCSLIPEMVRDILQRYSTKRKHKLFRAILLQNLSGVVTWKEIEQLTDKAIQRYDELVQEIETGRCSVISSVFFGSVITECCSAGVRYFFCLRTLFRIHDQTPIKLLNHIAR